MGLGGNLMWTGVIAALARDQRPLVLANQPKLTDLLALRLHDRDADIAADPVFRGNPHVGFTACRPKSALARRVDTWFMAGLEKFGLRRLYERTIAGVARARSGPLYLHLDMEIHSYAARQIGPRDRRRFIWKNGGSAIATMLAGLAPGRPPAPPEIRLDESDRARAEAALREAGVTEPFVVIEPETNREFFGDLRAWPFERWQALTATLATQGWQIVQIGLPGARRLEGASDLCGATDFRAACAVLARARLFLGTESGLMHAARAVGCDSVIVWGGVTLPEFAGYPDRHDIVCHRVACAPCGNLGWCDNGRICMLNIDVDEVVAHVTARLHIP